jgi:hypothetical protein
MDAARPLDGASRVKSTIAISASTMCKTIKMLAACGVTPGSILVSGLKKSITGGTKESRSAISAIMMYVRAGCLEKRMTNA